MTDPSDVHESHDLAQSLLAVTSVRVCRRCCRMVVCGIKPTRSGMEPCESAGLRPLAVPPIPEEGAGS